MNDNPNHTHYQTGRVHFIQFVSIVQHRNVYSTYFLNKNAYFLKCHAIEQNTNALDLL